MSSSFGIFPLKTKGNAHGEYCIVFSFPITIISAFLSSFLAKSAKLLPAVPEPITTILMLSPDERKAE